MSNASSCIKDKLWLRDQASFHVNNRLANQEPHHCPQRRVHSGTRREVGHQGESSVAVRDLAANGVQITGYMHAGRRYIGAATAASWVV